MADGGPRWWVITLGAVGALGAIAGIVGAIYAGLSYYGDEQERRAGIGPSLPEESPAPSSPLAPIKISLSYKQVGTSNEVSRGVFEVQADPYVTCPAYIDFTLAVSDGDRDYDGYFTWEYEEKGREPIKGNGKVISGRFGPGEITISAAAYVDERATWIYLEPFTFAVRPDGVERFSAECEL